MGCARYITATVLCCLAASGCSSPGVNPGEVGPRPLPITPPSRQSIQAAIDRGVAFLIQKQNKNGSWGNSRPKLINVWLPVPMGHLAVRGAVTALCVMALAEAESDQPGAEEALRRGEDWLLQNLPKVRVCSQTTMFNNWTHAYGIQALVRMLRREPVGPERRKVIRNLIRDQLDRLQEHQQLDGGWGYYKGTHFKRSPATSMTFTTATVMIAMHEASQAGFSIPKKIAKRAVKTLQAARRPDFAYWYRLTRRPATIWPISHRPGSLGRSQACNAATRLWGDKAVTLDVIKTWLDRLFARNGWLSMARKQRFPHNSYYDIAAYFYYYGHYYAGVCIGLLPPEDRPHFQHHLAHILLPLQEKDGSWWDFPLFDYHQQYGTAFALMALDHCLPPAPRESNIPVGSNPHNSQ